MLESHREFDVAVICGNNDSLLERLQVLQEDILVAEQFSLIVDIIYY